MPDFCGDSGTWHVTCRTCQRRTTRTSRRYSKRGFRSGKRARSDFRKLRKVKIPSQASWIFSFRIRFFVNGINHSPPIIQTLPVWNCQFYEWLISKYSNLAIKIGMQQATHLFIAPSKCLQQQQLLQFNLQKVGDVTAIFEISNLLSIRKSLISRLIRKWGTVPRWAGSVLASGACPKLRGTRRNNQMIRVLIQRPLVGTRQRFAPTSVFQ